MQGRSGCWNSSSSKISLCYLWKPQRERVFDNRNIYINTKVKVYKTIILPTLLYGSEAWTTYSRHLKNHERYCISVDFTLSSTSSGKINEQTVVFWKRQMLQWLSPILSRINFVWLVTLSVCLCLCSQRRPCTVNWPMGDVTRGGAMKML